MIPILCSVLTLFSISPADSARALLNIRFIPEAALYYAQMAAAEDGRWMLELGRILEASGRFQDARRVYGLALGNSSSQETSDWLINRMQGVTPLDTTITITVSVTNNGYQTAWDVQAVIPGVNSHPPGQEITVLESDFTSEAGFLTSLIPFIPPGVTVDRVLVLKVIQHPCTARPISTDLLTEGDLSWLSNTLESLPVPDAFPGPCVPMSEEIRRLSFLRGLDMRVEGGIILDRTGCIFHAWNVLENGNIRIDPLLFKEDTLLSIAHTPTDVIPLWDLGPTDGYELNILYSNPDLRITGTMKAEAR